MVARAYCSGVRTAQLTADVLRIRQPATTRPVLNELEMDPKASLWVRSIPARRALLRPNLGTPPRNR
jgi:hypothetical protein